MTIEVARLTEADIPAAIDIIQQAFADDPYFNWVFDKDRVSHGLDTTPMTKSRQLANWL